MAKLLADITPLQVSPQFRRLWWGQSLASFGGQFTAMAVALQIHDLTDSTLSVGLVGAFALVPLILLGIYGGTWIDRYDRRTVALISSLVLWGTAIAIAWQAWVGLDSVLFLYLLIAINSGASAVNMPARSAIIPRLIKQELMPAANALNAATGNLSMMVGPVLGAVVVAKLGFHWAYTIEVLAFTASLYAVIRLPSIRPLEECNSQPSIQGDALSQTTEDPSSASAVSDFRAIIDGFRFLATRPNIRMTFLVDLAAMVLANPWALFPAIGTDMIGGGDTTTGWLAASIAIGSTIAMVFSGPLGKVRRQGLVVVLMVVGWGASIAGFGVVLLLVGTNHPRNTIVWALVAAGICLGLAGAFDSVSSIFRNTILQVATPDALRGRLQGVFTVVVGGGPNLGRVLSGASAQKLRPYLPSPIGVTALIGGLLCVITVGLLHLSAPHFADYDAKNPQP